MNNLATRLGVIESADWYNIPERKLRQFARAKNFLLLFGSLFELLTAFYQDIPWEKERLIYLPKNVATNTASTRRFLDLIAPHLNVRSPEDWYRVSKSQIVSYGGSKLWVLFGSKMVNILNAAYPDITWSEERFLKKSKRTTQRQLAVVVGDAFPGHRVIEDFWLTTTLPGTGT